MKGERSGMLSPVELTALLPQEEKLEVGRKKSSLFIGLPKEISLQENRIAIIPEAVSLLVNNGHRVLVQSGAGKSAHFEDRDFSEAGAEIAETAREVYKADIIMKVSPPTLKEIDLMQPRQSIMSTLQITAQPKDYIKHLISKKISALAFDTIMDEDGIFPVIRSMGEIAGNTSVLIAAELLSNANKGKGLMLGGIAGVPASEIIILGAGTVGEFAARAALGLGATIKVFDNSLYKLRRMQNDLGVRVFTSIMQPDVLARELKTADVVIGAIRTPGNRTPCVITEEMVKEMQLGSVLIDVSIDHGGCSETSRRTDHKNPIYSEYGVIHYCVPNIASRVARTASNALSNIFAPILLQMGESGGFDQMIKDKQGLRHGAYLYKGILTDKMIGEVLNIPYKDIELLVAAL